MMQGFCHCNPKETQLNPHFQARKVSLRESSDLAEPLKHVTKLIFELESV